MTPAAAFLSRSKTDGADQMFELLQVSLLAQIERFLRGSENKRSIRSLPNRRPAGIADTILAQGAKLIGIPIVGPPHARWHQSAIEIIWMQ